MAKSENEVLLKEIRCKLRKLITKGEWRPVITVGSVFDTGERVAVYMPSTDASTDVVRVFILSASGHRPIWWHVSVYEHMSLEYLATVGGTERKTITLHPNSWIKLLDKRI